MLRARHLGWSLISSALFLAACADSSELGDQELAFGGGAGGGGGGCPEWGCTGNSPTIGPYELHELDLDRAPNFEGVAIQGVELGGVPVEVHFKGGDRIYVTDQNGNVTEGAGLDGLRFFLSSPTDRFHLVIQKVTPQASSPTRYWIGDPDRIETYELGFAYENHPNELRPVCRNPPAAETAPGGIQWPNRFEAILFTGDRYDGKKKLVTASSYEESRNWFNIACAGSVLAKMHLNKKTTAGSDSTHQSHREERQALLKMYTGDFCGEGFAFTEPGTPLHWADSQGWRKFDGNEIGFEAWWDAKGARCLTEHRLGTTYYNAVMASCHLDPCKGNPFPDEWEEGAFLKSAIPAP